MRASYGACFFTSALGQFLLGLKAGRARPALGRHETAKKVFVPPAMMRQLPRLHRAQSDRQASGFAKRALIILVNLRGRELLHHLAVAISVGGGVSIHSFLFVQSCR